MPKPTKILRLEIEAFKRLRAVEIKPDGNLVRITGRNAQGKSSVLDAIEAALGGKRSAPVRPVREGEKGARIVAELDGMKVTRTFTASGGGSLVVESTDGARYQSPQSILDGLVGKLSLDPLAFARQDPRARLETVRGLAGVDLSDLERGRAEAYETRTAVNRAAKRLEGQLAGLPEVEAPDALVSVGGLARELEEAQRAHDAVGRMEAERDRMEAAIANGEEKVEAKRQEIARLRDEVRHLEEKIDQAKGTHEELETKVDEAVEALPDLDAIRARLVEAEGINDRVRAADRRREVVEELEASRAESKALTARIDELDAEKRKRIAEAKLPVEGLGWDDDGVTLDGVPFDQASSAQKLRASVALALAANPQLRVLLVREGSLLDEDGLQILSEMAAEAGGQVWLERVDDRDGVGIVIEDGRIKGAEAEAAQ